MNDITLKYNMLDSSSKQEVLDFIHFLLKKKSAKRKKNRIARKNSLLKISVWNEHDIEELNQNLQKLNQWKTQEW